MEERGHANEKSWQELVDQPPAPQAIPPNPSPAKLLDLLCDAEQLHGLILAAEIVMDEIGDDPDADGAKRQYRLISRQDKKTLAALLRSARQLAEKMEADLGEVA